MRELLLKEFGAAADEKNASTIEFEESMWEDIKKKAEVVENRITAQLKALVKDEAVRGGRVPSSQPGKEG